MTEYRIAAPSPTRRELRHFGVILAFALVAVLGLLLPWLVDRPMPVWPWPLAGVLLALAVMFPRALAPLHHGGMALGDALGSINSRILLGVLFFVIIVPLGLLVRLLGKHGIAKGRDPAMASYRIDSAKKDSAKGMERPF